MTDSMGLYRVSLKVHVHHPPTVSLVFLCYCVIPRPLNSSLSGFVCISTPHFSTLYNHPYHLRAIVTIAIPRDAPDCLITFKRITAVCKYLPSQLEQNYYWKMQGRGGNYTTG